MKLFELTNELNARSPRRRVGRGTGCKKGKTSGRGQKGSGARSGYKRRYGFEGGGIPLHMRLPKRGFKRGFTVEKLEAINLWQIEEIFQEGEVVTLESLIAKGFLPKKSTGFKVLATGALSKKVTIEADHYSAVAKAALEQQGITFKTRS